MAMRSCCSALHREHKYFQKGKEKSADEYNPCYSEDMYRQMKGKTETLQEYCTQQDIPPQGGKDEIVLQRNLKKKSETIRKLGYAQL